MTELEKKLEAALRKKVVESQKLRNQLDSIDRIHIEPIAIVGMGCRLPAGVDSPESYWKFLYEGIEGISEVPIERWDVDEFYNPNPETVGKMVTRKGGFIKDAGFFDAPFFGVSPREARAMDPQQRLLLEVVWEALERSGIAPELLVNSRTGVYMGACNSDYSSLIQSGSYSQIESYSAIGTALNALNGRISDTLGLIGPSMTVDTACSSSLVSVHLACTSLQRGECDLAIAGGVNLTLSPAPYIMVSQAKMLAPDGHCKTFDASGDGYARGEGVGAIILKRLSDAENANDHILAIIRSTTVNHDGPSSGISVPSGVAQAKLILEALEKAKLQPTDISYIEAHGTGTKVGDPIEVGAIQATYGKGRTADNPLLLGSVKSNIGHLEGAAGIAGVIKLVLSLIHGIIPPNLHFKQLNPKIHLDEIPAKIITSPTIWKVPEGAKRLGGISSFGFTGTNAHLILEEAPLKKIVPIIDRFIHILTLSAKSELALKSLVEKYILFLDKTDANLADICYSANTGRNHERFRIAIIAKDVAELRKKLAHGDFIQDKVKEVSAFEIGVIEDWEKLINELTIAYPKGAIVDWGKIYPKINHNKVLLPTTPFQHKNYWAKAAIQGTLVKVDDVHPLLGKIFHLPGDITFFDCQANLRNLEYLNEFKLDDQYIFPSSGYIEMIIAATKLHFREQKIEIHHFIIEKILTYKNSKVELQTFLQPVNKNIKIEIFSKDASILNLSHLHAQAIVFTENSEKSVEIENFVLPSDGTIEVDVSKFYEWVERSKINDGNTKGLKKVYVQGSFLYGELKVLLDVEGYYFHPALLASCFDLLYVHLWKKNEESLLEHSYNLLKCEKLIVLGQLDTRAKVKIKFILEEENKILVDVFVYDQEGEPALFFYGLQFQKGFNTV